MGQKARFAIERPKRLVSKNPALHPNDPGIGGLSALSLSNIRRISPPCCCVKHLAQQPNISLAIAAVPRKDYREFVKPVSKIRKNYENIAAIRGPGPGL